MRDGQDRRPRTTRGRRPLRRSQLERAHPVWLAQCPRVGVAALDDVAEHLVERAGVAPASRGGPAGEPLELGDQLLQRPSAPQFIRRNQRASSRARFAEPPRSAPCFWSEARIAVAAS